MVPRHSTSKGQHGNVVAPLTDTETPCGAIMAGIPDLNVWSRFGVGVPPGSRPDLIQDGRCGFTGNEKYAPM